MYGSLILLIIIAVSSMPVIAVYVWFRIAKYQFTLIRFLLVMITGITAFFPALVLQDLINFKITAGRLELFYHVFIRIALTEELSRLLMLAIYFFISGYLVRNIDRSITEQAASWNNIKMGAATGLVAGLGFAILESTVYAASDIGILLLRTVTAAPLHAACGSRVGTAAIMFRTNPFQAIFRILSATAIHGVYNIMISRTGASSMMGILIAFSALFSSIAIIRGGWNAEENSKLSS
jgi:RsiW-degrading membrane proteinase PrsW (M82 family)